MANVLASILSLALVVACASAGGLGCPCGETRTADASGCHETGPGLTSSPMPCGCACLYAAPARPPASRIEPVVMSALPSAASSVLALAPRPSETIAVDLATADPPAPFRHQILRI